MDSNGLETTKLVETTTPQTPRQINGTMEPNRVNPESGMDDSAKSSFEIGFKTVRNGVGKLASKLESSRPQMIRLSSERTEGFAKSNHNDARISHSPVVNEHVAKELDTNSIPYSAMQELNWSETTDSFACEQSSRSGIAKIWRRRSLESPTTDNKKSEIASRCWSLNASPKTNGSCERSGSAFFAHSQHPADSGGNARVMQQRPSSAPTVSHTLQSRVDRGIRYFNLNPRKGLRYVLTSGVLTMFSNSGTLNENEVHSRQLEFDIPKAIARFLRETRGLNKEQVGVILGEDDAQSKLVLREYVNLFDFHTFTSSVQGVEKGLRRLLKNFKPPGEAQKIDRILSAFAEKFSRDVASPPQLATFGPQQDEKEDGGCDKKVEDGCDEKGEGVGEQENKLDSQDPVKRLSDSDYSASVVYMLAFITILLNVDLHNPNNPRKMTRKQFLRNCSNIEEMAGVGQEELRRLYDRLAKHEIRHVVDREDQSGNLFTNPDKCGWLKKKGPNAWSRWKYRWFILSANTLYYFRHKDDLDFLGFIPLESVQVEGSVALERVLEAEEVKRRHVRVLRANSACSECSTAADSVVLDDLSDGAVLSPLAARPTVEPAPQSGPQHARSRSAVPLGRARGRMERRFSRSYSFSLLRHLQASFKSDFGGSGRGATLHGFHPMPCDEPEARAAQGRPAAEVDSSGAEGGSAPRDGCLPGLFKERHWFELKPWDRRLNVKSARRNKRGELVLGQHRTVKLRVRSEEDLASWVGVLHRKGMLQSQLSRTLAAKLHSEGSYNTRFSISGIPHSMKEQQHADQSHETRREEAGWEQEPPEFQGDEYAKVVKNPQELELDGDDFLLPHERDEPNERVASEPKIDSKVLGLV